MVDHTLNALTSCTFDIQLLHLSAERTKGKCEVLVAESKREDAVNEKGIVKMFQTIEQLIRILPSVYIVLANSSISHM